jgi:hypothetical protein
LSTFPCQNPDGFDYKILMNGVLQIPFSLLFFRSLMYQKKIRKENDRLPGILRQTNLLLRNTMECSENKIKNNILRIIIRRYKP